MRVLYVNQTAVMSGAEHSLLTLLDALRPTVDAEAAVPAGDLDRELSRRGIAVHRIAGTDASFRLHPIHTPRAAAELAAAAVRVAGAARRGRFDVVHANTTRAGLIATAARRRGDPPVVVHVRDWVPEGRLPRAVLAGVRRRATVVVANSAFTAQQLLGTSGAPVVTLPNPVNVDAFARRAAGEGAARDALGLSGEDLVAGVVGQLTPWKGQQDAIRAVAALAPRHPRLRLVVAGSAKFAARSTRFDNRAYAAELRRLALELGIADRVVFAGEQSNVPAIMRALDVLLVPSWREAFGRVVVEGMAVGLPVVVTESGGPAEIVRDGVDGLTLPPRRPDLWAAALDGLLADAPRRAALGREARRRALDFRPEAAATAMREVYERATGAATGPDPAYERPRSGALELEGRT